MSNVAYLPDALDDLYAIWEYVARRSQSAEIADRLIDAIDDTARTYAGQPNLGIRRPDLAKDVRCFVVKGYVVFFIGAIDGIEVIQLIHGSRDIPVHFRN